MFSGIVQKVGTVVRVDRNKDGSGRLLVDAAAWDTPIVAGESIANNGVCLTVTKTEGSVMAFDLLHETFERTNLGDLASGSLVNLERALRVGDVVGGHFVTGHVDGYGITTAWQPHGRDFIWRISCARSLSLGMVPKGSIACDGISLTIVDLADDAFSVHIIPHTVEYTNLKSVAIGQKVNLETDMLGKYVTRAVAALDLTK